MINIDISVDVEPARKYLKKVQKQIPFAISQAINDTAIDATKALKVQAVKKLDRPTPFTLRGFRYKRSTKRHLVGVVYIADIQDRYLRYQVEGGTRARKNIGVPVRARLNKYGNIPGRRKGLIKKKTQFMATIKGINGVWERTKKGVKLMVAFEDRVTYRKRFPFYKIVKGIVTNRFKRHYDKRIIAALQTAR